MKRIPLAATLAAALALASCNGGGGSSGSSSLPPVQAAGPPMLSGTYSFSLTTFNTNTFTTLTGTFTATPPSPGATSGAITSGQLVSPGGPNTGANGIGCSNTFTGTFVVNNGQTVGTLTFSQVQGVAECYAVPGSANFTAAPASSGSRAFLSVAPSSSGAPAASGEAVLQ